MDHELCEFRLDSGHLFSMFMYRVKLLVHSQFIPGTMQTIYVLFAQRQCAFVNKIYIFYVCTWTQFNVCLNDKALHDCAPLFSGAGNEIRHQIPNASNECMHAS
jgi:hypothetical protein